MGISAELVYILCAATSMLCAFFLLRAYWATRNRLLLWTGICFVGFFFNNTLLFVDVVIFSKGPDLSLIRTIPAVMGLTVLIYGLIKEMD